MVGYDAKGQNNLFHVYKDQKHKGKIKDDHSHKSGIFGEFLCSPAHETPAIAGSGEGQMYETLL